MSKKSSNIVWHCSKMTKVRREQRNGHRAVVLWFTGLSASGKSTLAHAVEEALYARGVQTYVLDGDNMRHGLCSDLGFSIQDRRENIRRIAEAAKLLTESGIMSLAAFISPLREDRNQARRLFPHGDFLEIYCSAPLGVCESRDVKGLYKRARSGEVPEFTGISSPYEEPLRPELVINTGAQSLEDCVAQVLDLLHRREILGRAGLDGNKSKC